MALSAGLLPREMCTPARPEIQQPLHEWSSRRGSESFTLETDVYVWHYALLVVRARNEEEDCQKVAAFETFILSSRNVPNEL